MIKRYYLLFVMLFFSISLKAQSTIKVACVGDSITAGYGLANALEDSYPAQLAIKLGDGYSVNNYGVSGTTLLKSGDKPYWETTFFTNSLKWQPDIVIIMLGTNDSKDYNWINKSQFVPDFLEMIAVYRNLESNPDVYVVTSARVYGGYGSGQWGITDDVVNGEVVPLQKQLALEAGNPVIDINEATSNMAENFPDFIHPNETGAKVIAGVIFRYLAESKKAELGGDVNNDNVVNIVDALLIARFYVKLIDDIDQLAADLDCNGLVNIVDALLVAQYYVNLISLPL